MMAERKTFLFFCGWAAVLEDFSPEDRCAVYDAIIAYAENGSLPDTLRPELKMAFRFIRKDIDEMQAKYESICEKRKEAIRKRWDKDKQRKENTNNTNVYKSIQENTTDTSGYLHKHKHKHEHEHEHEHETTNTSNCCRVDNNIIIAQARVNCADADFIAEFFAPEKTATLEALAMQLRLGLDELRRMAQEVVNEWALTGQKHADYNDASRHLISTLRKRKQWSRPAQGGVSSEPGLGIGEYRDAKGRRRYAQSDVIVPESAPPRPSAGHWWSEAGNLWSDQI